LARVVDLTQDIHPGMQLFPVFPKPSFVLWTRRETYGFETEAMFLVTHTGTHVDAPYHFHAGGIRVDQIPPERLLGPGLLLDFSDWPEKGLIGAEDLRRAEGAAGTRIQRGDIVLIRTGWDRYLGSERYASGYPGLSREAAQYLLDCGAAAVGVDSPNPDHPDAGDFPVHNTLLPREVLIIENLANLGAIGRPRFRFIGLPLKIRGGTGSPIRAVAIVE